MRRVRVLSIAVLMFLAFMCWGCAGSADGEKKMTPTLATVKPAKGYVKKIAVTLAYEPPTAMGKQMGTLFFDTLVQSIKAEGKRIQLVTPGDEGFPAFMANLSQQPARGVNAIDLAKNGRLAGYNGLVAASLRGIRPYTKKSGILWFRKVRYYISFDLTVDLYDPLTAAKIIGVVEEASIKVSDIEYEAFQEGIDADVEDLKEEIVEFGEDIGELVAEALDDRFWRTSVVKVENQRIYLPAGRQAGLSPGVRLSVFEGRQVIESQANERFIVPGPHVDTIKITSVGRDVAEAVASGDGEIRVGDIAVPVK